MIGERYYQVIYCDGRWNVCHPIASAPGWWSSDGEFLTQVAAERERARLEAQRQREQRELQCQRVLLYRAGRSMRSFA